MPYPSDLEKVREQAHKDAMLIAFSGNKNHMVMQLEKVLVEAYIAGYKQCEQDYPHRTMD